MALPNTFGELTENLLAQLLMVQCVDFVTDSYHPLSIKGIERARRGSSKRLPNKRSQDPKRLEDIPEKNRGTS